MSKRRDGQGVVRFRHGALPHQDRADGVSDSFAPSGAVFFVIDLHRRRVGALMAHRMRRGLRSNERHWKAGLETRQVALIAL